MDTQVQQKVNEVKAKGHSVFKVPIAKREFIYRSINRQEYGALQKSIAEDSRKIRTSEGTDEEKEESIALMRERGEEKLVLLALVYPEVDNSSDFTNLPAGVISTLADMIMQASGFGVDVEPVEL